MWRKRPTAHTAAAPDSPGCVSHIDGRPLDCSDVSAITLKEQAAEAAETRRIEQAQAKKDRQDEKKYSDLGPPPTPARSPRPTTTPTPSADGYERTGTSARTYARSKNECSVFSPQSIASTYGGNPSDLGSVAHAYAEKTTMTRFLFDAEEGCLDGLLK